MRRGGLQGLWGWLILWHCYAFLPSKQTAEPPREVGQLLPQEKVSTVRLSWVTPKLMILENLFRICCVWPVLACGWGGSREVESYKVLCGLGTRVLGSLVWPPGQVSGTLLPRMPLFLPGRSGPLPRREVQEHQSTGFQPLFPSSPGQGEAWCKQLVQKQPPRAEPDGSCQRRVQWLEVAPPHMDGGVCE